MFELFEQTDRAGRLSGKMKITRGCFFLFSVFTETDASLVSVRLPPSCRAGVFFFLSILYLSFAPPTSGDGGGAASRLRAAALLVELDLMLEAVVQFEVVVLQCGGGARRQPTVGARAVEQQAGAHCTQQDAQRAHDDDGDQDGVQGVQPRVVLV